MLAQLGAHVLRELARVAAIELPDPFGDPLEHLRRRQTVGPAGVDPGLELIMDPGHTDHEELVQVGDEDGQELQSLDQRQALVLGELKHAIVELEP